MPIHDWTRVSAGTFHDFHTAWIVELRRFLNGGVLPGGYYALAEQVASGIVADVLTLQDKGAAADDEPDDAPDDFAERGAGPGPAGDAGVAVAEAPPRVAVCDRISEATVLASRRRRLVLRHTTGDRIVALLEIVSPGNKDGRGAMGAFIDKAAGALKEGVHLLLIDLLPPGTFDPRGTHGALWQSLGGGYTPPAGKPLTLAAYAAGQPDPGTYTCYVEPVAVGAELIPMPLFFDPGHYVNIPLEATYRAAYEGVPRRWKRVIEGGPA